MLEAPYTGSDVHVSPVRTAGLTPYVIRYIDTDRCPAADPGLVSMIYRVV
jgi:hypothetical protein